MTSVEEVEAVDVPSSTRSLLLLSSPSAAATADVEVEFSFPGHTVAHYITIPGSIATTYLTTAAMHVMDERQHPARDMSKQVASYADQVKEMKGRINWLKESLRRSGPCAAEEHAQDLGKFFAVQSIKVEELGQQIDVFSEELRQWKDADNNRFSALARAVIQGDVLDSGKPVENVRVQLSDLVDLVREEEKEEDQRPCLSISRSELEMKRKAMGARMKCAKHEAKRRKVQEVRLPFKVGIPSSTRRVAERCDGRKSQGGVRTVQLRRSNNSSNNSKGKGGGANSTMTCINSLQKEVLRLKEILEERELQLSTEQRKRCDMENRHTVEARAFLKEAEDKTRQLKLEQTMRVQAEEKVVVLQAALQEAQEQHDAVEPVQAQRNPVYVDDGVQVSNDEADPTTDQEERPPTRDVTLNRLYERELAINATHLRQALKLKSIAEAKVENLKKQVIALKKLTGELQYEQQQHGRLRKETGNVVEVERLQTQILQLKKRLAFRTKELETENVKNVDDDEQVSSTVLRLENEVVSYKKLALDRAAELRAEKKHRCQVENQVKELRCQLDDLGAQDKLHGQHKVESHSYDAISHKQNRRLQLSLKKSRQNYEQLHEFWRKEQECRLSSDAQCRKLQSICSTHAERLDELGSSLEDLLEDIEEQRGDTVDKKRQKKDVRVASSPDSKLETSEKLLLLLDKLAKGLDGEQEVHLVGGVGRKPEILVAEMRNQVREMARSLRQELQVQPEMRSGKEALPDSESLQQVPTSFTAEQQVVYLGRLCTLQSKKLRAAEGRVATLKKHVSRLRDVTERPDREREQERAWRADSGPKNNGSEVAALKQQLQRLKAANRLQDSDSIARLKLLEIQVLEYKRQAEEKAKDLKHERSVRFDLESKSAAEIQRLRQELQIARPQQQDECLQAEESSISNEMGVHALELQVFVLELLVGEKTEALLHEKKERGDVEGRMHELATLLSCAQVEIANANERAEELSQLCVCQGHKVAELTGLLELFVKKLDEYEKCQVEMEDKLCVEHDQRSRISAELQQEHADKLRLETELAALDGMIWNSGGSDEFVRLTSMSLEEDEAKGCSSMVTHASARLKSCEDFIGNLKKHVKDLELSGEVLRYRDKVWRRGLLAIDQVLLLCFGALFAFNRMTVMLREIVPT